MNANAGFNRRCLRLPTLAATGMIVLAATDAALAGHRPRLVTHPASKVWIEPVYKTVTRTIFVPPVYETLARKVWHEPVYETRRVLVEVPAEIARRRVPRRAECGRPIGYDTAGEVIRSPQQSWQIQKVLARSGFFETLHERVLVRPGATKLVHEQVLVRSGHWEMRPRLIRRHYSGRQARRASARERSRRVGTVGVQVSFGLNR